MDNNRSIIRPPAVATVRNGAVDAGTSPIQIARSYGITMRPYLMFVSGITGIAGISLLSHVAPLQFILVSLACFLSYGFGQALTDCFQTDTDALSSPYRPLVRGEISKRQVMTISLAGLCICVSILAVYNAINIILGLIAGYGLATYTPFKRRWWGGPFYNAWIVALLCFMAYSTGSHDLGNKDLFLTLTAVFFGYANFVLTGYFKDIEADRATGYFTLPVVFGRKTSSFVSDVFARVQFVTCLTLIMRQEQDIVRLLPGLLFCMAGATTSVVAQIRLHRVRTDADAHRAIALVVHGYILFLSGIASALHPAWTLFMICYYGAFIVVLKLRPEKSQI